jgi:hypothetical protein
MGYVPSDEIQRAYDQGFREGSQRSDKIAEETMARAKEMVQEAKDLKWKSTDLLFFLWESTNEIKIFDTRKKKVVLTLQNVFPNPIEYVMNVLNVYLKEGLIPNE